jgi:hypothetical protein
MGRGGHVSLRAPPASSGSHSGSRATPSFLSAFPAELLSQARAFYRDRARVERILELTSAEEWTVRPNGHLSYSLAAPERRWCFKHGSLDAADYMRQWQDDLEHVHSHARDAVPTELWPWLVRRRYVGEADRGKMRSSSPVPGRRCVCVPVCGSTDDGLSLRHGISRPPASSPPPYGRR